MKPKIQLLSQDEIELIHGRSLDLLKSKGVRYQSERALHYLKEAGQEVNYDTLTVKISPGLVEECLRSVPKLGEMKLCGRDEKHDFILDGSKTHYISGYGCSDVLDFENFETGKRHPPTTSDIKEAAVIADALDIVDVIWLPAFPTDYHPLLQNLQGQMICFINSTKHIQDEVRDIRVIPYILAMLDAILGDRQKLKERPIFSLVHDSMSPLQWEKTMTEASMELAKHWVPIAIHSRPQPGLTSPITSAATLLQGNAEFLSGLVLFQLVQPGLPVIYSVSPTMVDPHSGISVHARPEEVLMQTAAIEIARYYKLPCWQWDVSRLAQPDLDSEIGRFNNTMTLFLEKMIIDAEYYDMTTKIHKGIEVDDEHLMEDVIKRTEFGGNFLGDPTTRDRWRQECFITTLGKHGFYQLVGDNPSRETLKIAHERVKQILSNHQVKPPLPTEVIKELEMIMERAQADLT